MKYGVNEQGYYGDFGGAYIPEMLYPNVEELRQEYLKILTDPALRPSLISFKRLRGQAFAFVPC
jgi:tryptophan synthase beta subunit